MPVAVRLQHHRHYPQPTSPDPPLTHRPLPQFPDSQYANDELDPETSTLWFAGKSMQPEKKLSDHLGRNERTKVVVKLQKKGSGAPAREPPVDAATQKAMLAYYYKKQEEEKKLAQDADDSYTSAAWASGNSLKQHFSGVSSVRIPR